MKIHISLLLLFLSFFINAQSLMKKVPSSAKMVLEIDGGLLSQQLNLEEIDNYDFIKKFIENDKPGNPSSLKELGIKLNAKHYQFIESNDSVLNFVAMFKLDGSHRFSKIMEKKRESSLEQPSSKHIETKKFHYYLDDEVAIAWNNEILTFVFANYYYSHSKEREIDAEHPQEDYNSRRKIREEKKDRIKKQIVFNLFNRIYSDRTYENAKLFTAKKENAHLYLWGDYNALMDKYYTLSVLPIMTRTRSILPRSPSKDLEILMRNQQIALGANLFFKKNEIVLDYTIISENNESAKALHSIYNSTLDHDLIQFIDKDAISCISVNVNTEPLIHQYYKTAKTQMLQHTGALGALPEEIDVLFDFIDLMTDEKAIAELIPGKAVFILNDLESKTIDYETFEYDDDYNAIPITKTKEELSPSFRFFIKTENPDFVEKLIRAQAKNKMMKEFITVNSDGIYHFSIKDNIIPDLYYTIKDDLFMLATDKNFFQEKGGNLTRKMRKKIKKSSNYSYLNLTKLFEKLAKSSQSKQDIKIMGVLTENTESITSYSKMQRDNLETKLILKTKGKHKNSFAYIFDVINESYIYAKEQISPEIKNQKLEIEPVEENAENVEKPAI